MEKNIINTKPWYRKWWIIALVTVILILIFPPFLFFLPLAAFIILIYKKTIGNKGVNNYKKLLRKIVSDGKIDEIEKKELEEEAKKYNLSEKDILKIHKKGAELAFRNIISDQRITDEEKEDLEKLTNYFGIELKDFKFDQKSFNKYYTLGLIEKGILPNIKQHDIDIIFKEGEILHWGCSGELRKYKQVTNRVSYGGFGASIKIMKGVRYRVGSFNVSSSSSEHLVTEDTGIFWLTNQRIGFKGKKKNFNFPYSKIHAFELNNSGLVIAKDGRDSSYIVGLEDYEVPCMMISFIINNFNQ